MTHTSRHESVCHWYSAVTSPDLQLKWGTFVFRFVFVCLATCHCWAPKSRSALLCKNITRLCGCICSRLLFFLSKHLFSMCGCPSCLVAERRTYPIRPGMMTCIFGPIIGRYYWCTLWTKTVTLFYWQIKFFYIHFSFTYTFGQLLFVLCCTDEASQPADSW